MNEWIDFTEFSTDALVGAVIQLTQRVRDLRGVDGVDEKRSSLREQRAAVRAEIVRRAGDVR